VTTRIGKLEALPVHFDGGPAQVIEGDPIGHPLGVLQSSGENPSREATGTFGQRRGARAHDRKRDITHQRKFFG
jgi:hypothetical protein